MKAINKSKDIVGDVAELDGRYAVSYTWTDHNDIEHHSEDIYKDKASFDEDWRILDENS